MGQSVPMALAQNASVLAAEMTHDHFTLYADLIAITSLHP